METTISIHAPRAGSDLTGMSDPEKWIRFQSTLPVRGATSFSRAAFAGSCYFNPRSPCGERHTKAGLSQRFTRISIHAPRAGSDPTSKKSLGVILYFNPRSPCGERRRATRWQRSTARFQSTLPVRGATTSHALAEEYREISIHAPRAGSDANLDSMPPLRLSRFQSTLPVRGATMQLEIIVTTRRDFNPRSPCGERRE